MINPLGAIIQQMRHASSTPSRPDRGPGLLGRTVSAPLVLAFGSSLAGAALLGLRHFSRRRPGSPEDP